MALICNFELRPVRKRSSRSLSSSRVPPPPYSPDSPVYNEGYHLEPWESYTDYRHRPRRPRGKWVINSFLSNPIFHFPIYRKSRDIQKTPSSPETSEPPPVDTNDNEAEIFAAVDNNNNEDVESENDLLMENIGKPRNPPIISEIEEELRPENRFQSKVSVWRSR